MEGYQLQQIKFRIKRHPDEYYPNGWVMDMTIGYAKQAAPGKIQHKYSVWVSNHGVLFDTLAEFKNERHWIEYNCKHYDITEEQLVQLVASVISQLKTIERMVIHE